MRRLAILASVVAVAVVSANCSNSREGGSSASIMAPSAVESSAVVSTQGKGGGGGGGGKPGGGGTTSGSGSLALVLVADNNANGLPNWNDSITFTVSTTATDKPNVSVACYQSNTLVYAASTGYYASYPWPATQIMNLKSEVWTGGAASCTATLSYIDSSGVNSITLGSMSFRVGA